MPPTSTRMKHWIPRLAPIVGLALGCGGGVSTGVRSDGVTVTCQDDGDDVHVCDPQPPADDPPADTCDDWQDGGPALVLWPPNHKLYQFTLADCATIPGECTADSQTALDPSAYILAVTSDEPLEVGAGGDGHTPTGDLAIVDATTVLLRAERQGGGDGRVYRIHFTDDSGAIGACEVLVPHDRGPFEGAIDSGEAVRVEL